MNSIWIYVVVPQIHFSNGIRTPAFHHVSCRWQQYFDKLAIYSDEKKYCSNSEYNLKGNFEIQIFAVKGAKKQG